MKTHQHDFTVARISARVCVLCWAEETSVSRDERIDSLEHQLREAEKRGEYAWQLAQSMVPPEALEASEEQVRRMRILLRKYQDSLVSVTNIGDLPAVRVAEAALRESMEAEA